MASADGKSLYSRLFGKRSPKEDVAPAPVVKDDEGDIKLSTGKPSDNKVPEALKNFQRPGSPIKYSSTQSSRAKLGGPEPLFYVPAHYDLAELAKARDIESLFQTSIERHVEQGMAQGWDLVGGDEEMVDYIRDRFFEIELVSEKKIDEILREGLDQLACYGTVIGVVRRDKDRSSGAAMKKFGVAIDPIAALVIGDAPQFQVSIGPAGKPKGWRQVVQGAASGYNLTSNAGLAATKKDVREYHYLDVYVGARFKQPGRIFGRPMAISVLDDMASLRRLEELMDIIPQKHLFPLFQYIVGTEDMPAGEMELPDGSKVSEVDFVREEIDNMPTEGGFVTPERHEIKLLGSEGKVLDINPFIEHFYRRVQQGLRLSDTVLGKSDGQSKSSAGQQMAALHESARSLQRIMEEVMDSVIMDLLLEGGYSVNRENAVTLVFHHPNPEETRADQTHHLNMFNSGLATESEGRKAMGRHPMTAAERKQTGLGITHEREKEMVAEEHERAKSLAKTEASSHERMMTANIGHEKAKAKTHEARAKVVEAQAKLPPKKPAAGAKKRKRTKSGAKAQVHRIQIGVHVQPVNQHGRKSTKTKVTANDFETPVADLWSTFCDTYSRKGDLTVLSALPGLIENEILGSQDAKDHAQGAVEASKSITEDPYLFPTDEAFKDAVHRSVHGDLERLIASIGGADTAERRASCDTARVLLDKLVSEIPQLIRASTILACLRKAGFDELTLISDDEEESDIMLMEDTSPRLLLKEGDGSLEDTE